MQCRCVELASYIETRLPSSCRSTGYTGSLELLLSYAVWRKKIMMMKMMRWNCNSGFSVQRRLAKLVFCQGSALDPRLHVSCWVGSSIRSFRRNWEVSLSLFIQRASWLTRESKAKCPRRTYVDFDLCDPYHRACAHTTRACAYVLQTIILAIINFCRLVGQALICEWKESVVAS